MTLMDLTSQETTQVYQAGIEQGLDVVGSPAVAMQRFAQRLDWFRQTTSVNDEQALTVQQHELTALAEMLVLLANAADVTKQFMDFDVGRAELVKAMSELRSKLVAHTGEAGCSQSTKAC